MDAASLDCSLRATQRSLRSAADPQRVCATGQERRHLAAIDNGVQHMKLDANFLANSQLWRQQQPQQQLQQHASSAGSALASSRAFLQDYSAAMSSDHVASLRENQLAANRAAALEGFGQLRQQFDPPARESHDRVQRFCDWIGVTDRFTGYRHNLTRGSRQPLEFSPPWRRGDAGRGLPDLRHPKFVSESLHTAQANRFNLRSKSAPAARTQEAGRLSCSYPEKTPQEKAGIPAKFPGSTEYYDRYRRPLTSRTKFDYTINPQPDFTALRRPLMKAEVFERPSEYEDRYVWPDSRNLQPVPWRKC